MFAAICRLEKAQNRNGVNVHFGWRIQWVSATPSPVYRLEFENIRSLVAVD